MNAITTGVMAGRAIVYGKDYEKLIKNLVKNNLYMYEFRKAFNRLNNKDYDRLITTIGLPGIKQLFYDTSFNVGKYGGEILKIINKKIISKG
jgi:flavin-dependent dehydrogenase